MRNQLEEKGPREGPAGRMVSILPLEKRLAPPREARGEKNSLNTLKQPHSVFFDICNACIHRLYPAAGLGGGREEGRTSKLTFLWSSSFNSSSELETEKEHRSTNKKKQQHTHSKPHTCKKMHRKQTQHGPNKATYPCLLLGSPLLYRQRPGEHGNRRSRSYG